MYSATKQAIIQMVMDNKCIRDYEKAKVDNYEVFGLDFPVLSFVQKQYAEMGMVTLGDLMLRFPEFDLSGIDAVSSDVDGVIYKLLDDYFYAQLEKSINNPPSGCRDSGLQLYHYLQELVDKLSCYLPTARSYAIMARAQERYEEYQKRAATPNIFIPTGFAELDQLIGGWSKRDGELASLLARMGMGKTWWLLRSCTAAYEAGFNCGILSVEMSPSSIGTRVDTLESHLSNAALRKGLPVDLTVYQEYLNKLKNSTLSNDMYVKTKRDFDGLVTPTKIENWIRQDKLDIIFLDGISYISSERKNAAIKNDASSITDVAEDLMAISSTSQCPVVLTQQSNRSGADRSLNPGLDSARGSDGVNINASFVASMAYPDAESREILRLEVLKSRYGKTGAKFDYRWNPDIGFMRFEGDGGSANGQSTAYFGKNN